MSKAKEFKFGKAVMPVCQKQEYPEYVPDASTFIVDSSPWVEDVLMGASKAAPVLLIGPTGCGKTAAVKWLANQTNNAYRRVQLNGAVGIDTFVGRWLLKDGNTVWQDGVLTDAMRKGHWLLLDELNAALPEILFVLHSVMDDDRRLILDEKDGEIIQAHENFRVFAAINPSEDYAGTKELNRALIDRFPIVLPVDYPPEEQEVAILLSQTPLKDEDAELEDGETLAPVVRRIVKVANALRLKQKENQLLFPCSTRQLVYWGKFVSDYGVKKAAGITIVNRADPEDRGKILDEINKMFRDGE